MQNAKLGTGGINAVLGEKLKFKEGKKEKGPEKKGEN